MILEQGLTTVMMLFSLMIYSSRKNQMTTLVSSVCFRVFDTDGDGFLSRSEIEVMCKALIDIRKENNVGEKASFFVMS